MAKRFIGIDLNDKYAMISYYTRGMSEPGTYSTVTGSESYQIPVCISKKEGEDYWFFGEHARTYAAEEGVFCVDGLLRKALAEEKVELEETLYEASELLFLFLNDLICLPLQLGEETQVDRLVITVEYMNLELRNLFGLFAERIALPADRLLLLDYRESFYYYALSQTPELCSRDVVLYYYTSKKLFCWRLSHDRQTIPQVVTIAETRYESMLRVQDEEFAVIAEGTLSGQPVSAVYLIGDGFDGGWMKKSLAAICQGRRAFMGKNLFSKGACYGAAVKSGQIVWQYVYMGDNEVKVNVGLKVINNGETEFLTLINAGDNWYEAGGEWEVILGGSPALDLYFQPPDGAEAMVRSLILTDLPKREDRTTRLRICVKPVAADQIGFSIRDLGFGEIVKSSDRIWEHIVKV